MRRMKLSSLIADDVVARVIHRHAAASRLVREVTARKIGDCEFQRFFDETLQLTALLLQAMILRHGGYPKKLTQL